MMGLKLPQVCRFYATRVIVGLSLLTGWAICPTTAYAQTPLDGLKACREITVAADRLACFDRASDALVGAASRNEVIVMGKDEVRKTRRSLFGFALPRIALFGSDRPGTEDVDVLNVTIQSARMLADDKWAFVTDDGARWQTTEFSRTVPKVGGKAVIKRGALGSFFVKFQGGTSTRARRTD